MSYDLTICYHPRAKRYLKKLGKKEQDVIIGIIHKRIMEYMENNDCRYIHQDAYFSKLGNFDSTVYYLKISLRERAIISIDEDPIFEKTIVSIFDICTCDKLEVEIKGIMESLYQKMINSDDSEDE